jgi:hypothetical protein
LTQAATATAWRPVSRNGPLAAFGAALAVTLIVALSLGKKPFYYDANLYWSLGDSFVRNGHFSLLNFENPLRGYAFPLVNHELLKIAGDLKWSASTIVRVFNALLFALIGAVLAPRLAEEIWPGRPWGAIRRLTLTALLLVFWSGYLSFPLSDFPALCMVLLAIVAIVHPDAPGWMLVAGIAAGLAIDIRPEYVSLAVVLPLLLAWTWFKGRRRRSPSAARRLLCVGLLLAGFAGVSLPQALSSHRHHGTWSFLPGSAGGIAYIQLTDGLGLQRYETYVGSGALPAMYYIDPQGLRILREQNNQRIESLSQYLGLLVSHPLAMASLFMHHLVNGLDPRYNTPYVEHIGSNIFRRLVGFLLVFLALVRVLWPTARRGLSPTRWRYPAALLACCVTTLSSAMETRFLLPVYLLVYMLVLAPGRPSLYGAVVNSSQPYRLLAIAGAACLPFAALIWYVTSDATSHLVFG